MELFLVDVNLLSHGKKIASKPIKGNGSGDAVGDYRDNNWEKIFHL